MTLVERVKAILASPDSEWRVIDRESGEPAILFVNYVAYLAAIPAVAGFIGMTIIGFTVPTVGTLRVPPLSGLLAAIFNFVLAFAVVYAVALIIDLLAPSFDGRRNFGAALKLAVYSFTPFWLSCIFLLIPGLQFLIMLGLYGLYLLYKGLPVLMKCPAGRSFGYAAAVVASAVVIELLVRAIRAAMFTLPSIA